MDVETLAVKLTRATMKLPIGPLSATLGQATPRFEQPTIDIRIVGRDRRLQSEPLKPEYSRSLV
ncbi:hypothetical protein BofuT4_uP131820.1 [Botrytis cinerea T4]|uniref:Uncharacterized protein n=1 Tax=Botryotinia fuckeliana (strain T4) TaxID=999810 RepID=G2YQV4_BOTF4|nr:hypothetical protein BofuT4_uP131820.1 [Botrytis cinerea T4]